MALLEGKTQSERIKTIAALVLPLLALALIFRMFFASDPKPAAKTPPRRATGQQTQTVANNATAADGAADGDAIQMPSEVPQIIPASYAPEAARNIFAFYVPPVDPRKLAALNPTETPTPTPTPPPPLTLGSLQPANVFARTGDFALTVAGDKFTPQTRIYLDGQELPTKFVSPQQLAANVPAAFVQAPGARAVIVRTPDNSLYSNTQTVNVMPPPTPQFTFIGIIGVKHYNDDKAILKPTAGSELLTVKRGDIVGGRFKVTSISERAVEFTDTQLNIKHSIPYTDAKGATGGSAVPRAPQQSDDDDGEP
jgi:IPT/TIG domain